MINLDEYKDKLQAVFMVDNASLKELHRFTDEKLTYRAFTLFNFLGELRQGALVDFFDKCNKVEYYTKINLILDFIFNNKVDRICFLKSEIRRLKNDIRQLESYVNNNEIMVQKINLNLSKLNLNVKFDGNNGDDVLKKLNLIENVTDLNENLNTQNSIDVQILYNNIDEQIKVYKKYIKDFQEDQIENINREKLLKTFEYILDHDRNYEYLIAPMKELVNEIKNSISFSQYIIKEDVVRKLENKKISLQQELDKIAVQQKRFSLDEKKKAKAIIEDSISSYDKQHTNSQLEEKKKTLENYKNELNELLKLDNEKKIESIGLKITKLYISAKDNSDFIKTDLKETNEKFYISYIKKRNALQAMYTDENGKELVYGIGSHARYTLIQLCGYLAFMEMLIKDKKCPIIPLIVIDHISKPFSKQNIGTIGAVINKAYESIGIENLQIFMFEDKNCEMLNINPNHVENLFSDVKTGFNPFYQGKN